MLRIESSKYSIEESKSESSAPGHTRLALVVISHYVVLPAVPTKNSSSELDPVRVL